MTSLFVTAAGAAADAVTAHVPSLVADGVAVLRREPAVALTVTAVITAHAVMVAVMSMTPVHLARLAQGSHFAHAGHASDLHTGPGTFVVIGLVISLHIAGMYALSPAMGHLADR